METQRNVFLRIKAVDTGHRLENGTEWPIQNVLYRELHINGARRFKVAFGLCNGVPIATKLYRTRKAAEADL